MMYMNLPKSKLKKYIENLLAIYLPDGKKNKIRMRDLGTALERLEYCFSKIKKKYYNLDGVSVFNHLNSDHMSMFLWFLSNTIWLDSESEQIPTKIFYVNKIMHGIDLYFKIKMPDIFILVHPIGTIIGNAIFRDYLVVYQNCTIGSNNNQYPEFGEGTILFSKSSIIGKCKIGDNVIFGANSFIIDKNINDNQIVLGQHPSNRLIKNHKITSNWFFGN
jgi:serine O-acetyltransferase